MPFRCTAKILDEAGQRRVCSATVPAEPDAETRCPACGARFWIYRWGSRERLFDLGRPPP